MSQVLNSQRSRLETSRLILLRFMLQLAQLQMKITIVGVDSGQLFFKEKWGKGQLKKRSKMTNLCIEYKSDVMTDASVTLNEPDGNAVKND